MTPPDAPSPATDDAVHAGGPDVDAAPGTADPRDPAGRLIVDATGMPCPQPVLELAAAIADVAVGDEVRLLATDEAATVDVPVWCRMRRQLLVEQGTEDGVLWFVVRKLREA